MAWLCIKNSKKGRQKKKKKIELPTVAYRQRGGDLTVKATWRCGTTTACTYPYGVKLHPISTNLLPHHVPTLPAD